ncbi:MAG: hypothetical protein ABID04_01580 [Patescibacteria group bacterium]
MIKTSNAKKVGIAKTAPAVPASLKPTASAKMVITGLTPTDFCISLGTIKLFSNCWTMKAQAKTSKPISGEIVKPISIAGMAAKIGPILGTISKNPAMIANGKAKLKPNKRKPTYDKTPIKVIKNNSARTQPPNFNSIFSTTFLALSWPV